MSSISSVSSATNPYQTTNQNGFAQIAAPAAGNEDFLAWGIGMVDQQHTAPTRSGGHGAHHARGAGAEDDGIPWLLAAHAPTMLRATASATLIPSIAAERMPPA